VALKSKMGLLSVMREERRKMWSNELCEDIPVNFLFGRVKDDPTA
jgi:hypothetical protein